MHRCQEDDGRVQVLMVERPSSLKLWNKQRIHRNGSDQYIKNYYKMCHVMMEYLFKELKQSVVRKSSSRKKVLSFIEKEQFYSCYMRFGATLMCGTISVHVTLVVLFVFIKANGEELGLQTVFE